MEKKITIKTGLVISVAFLFIMIGIFQTTATGIDLQQRTMMRSDTLHPLIATQNEGSLSGYVTDQNMDPLENALVRVSFHDTYEEDYTDSSGYYHVTNIPICYCLKNATASKEGYSMECVLLSIGENTEYDFVLQRDDVLCGDVNGDGIINIADPVYMINILFNIWPELSLDCRADVNGDGAINISDVVYLINYIFIPGCPAPVSDCCDSS